MPNDPSVRLEWNEENFSRVLSNIYREAETNAVLRSQLLANPFEILTSRIDVPETYEDGIFAREKAKPIIMLYVPPASGSAGEAMPQGTSDAVPQPDYAPICTTATIW